jgi:aryl-alcohol dehydrogenase-like predicted oxidoreductase
MTSTTTSAPPGAPAPASLPVAVLGRTGATVSRLGLGCAAFRRPELGVAEVTDLIHRAVELGVTYLDVAPSYGDATRGFAEEKMGPAVRALRDRLFLVTKTEEPTYEGTWRSLRQSLARLQTDHLDLVHLHNLGYEPRFPDLGVVLGPRGALAALREARQQGIVRFIGASGHLHPSRFHAALDTGEVDVLMNAVNFVAQHTYDFEHKVWARARQQNLGLVAMKVLGGERGYWGLWPVLYGGRPPDASVRGFMLPEDTYERAIRYALSIPGVATAVIGLGSRSELEQAAGTVAGFRPLTRDEAHELALEGLRLAGTREWRAAYGKPVT